jgi:hypothetical protein
MSPTDPLLAAPDWCRARTHEGPVGDRRDSDVCHRRAQWLSVAYTLILVGLFWNGAGSITQGQQGQIAWAWLPMLLAGSIAGGYLGAHLAIAKGSQLVKRSFEVLALLMGSSLLWKSF